MKAAFDSHGTLTKWTGRFMDFCNVYRKSAILCALVFLNGCATKPPLPPPAVELGGPCGYTKYEGLFEVVGKEVLQPGSYYSLEIADVSFKFRSKEYIGPKFTGRVYGAPEVGQSFAGELQVETSGFHCPGLFPTLEINGSPIHLEVSPVQDSKGIDKVLVDRVQIAPGRTVVLTLHIWGKSIDDPFTWQFMIMDVNGRGLYAVQRNDAWLDAFFKDPGYVGDCNGYRDCKQRYYFHDLPKSIFSVLNASKTPWLRDAYDKKDLQEVAGRYLKGRGLPPEQAEQVLQEMEQILAKPGFHVLDVPRSPVQSDFPMIWVPSVRSFVPFHED